ncbi:MAG: hypothetical protein LAT65_05815 [Saccharospirillum sp.]|nr:hypothetical protein [Saccharospirillum sp.]
MDIGILFWVDEAHSSNQSDQTRMIQRLKNARSLLSELNIQDDNYSLIIEAHTEIKKQFTNTPATIHDYSGISKPRKYQVRIERASIALGKIRNVLESI